jgi:hypothetical protein
MQAQTFVYVDSAIERVARLAERLTEGDPDGHVRRSVEELRAAFAARAPVEPVVARVLRSVELLTAANHDGCRREFDHRAPGVERIAAALKTDLLPELRRLGFEV